MADIPPDSGRILRMDGFVCRTCGKTYKSRGGLSTHERSHTGKAPYRCCGKMFFSQTNLERHRCAHHNAPKPFKCDQCAFTCGVKGDLTSHKNLAHAAPKFVCQVCERKFTTQGKLNDHTGSHSGENRHICTCGKAYRYSSGLSKHRKKCRA